MDGYGSPPSATGNLDPRLAHCQPRVILGAGRLFGVVKWLTYSCLGIRRSSGCKKHPGDTESVTECTSSFDEEMARSTSSSENDVRELPIGYMGHSTIDSLDDVGSPGHMPSTLSQALQQYYGPGYDAGGPRQSSAAVRESFLTSSTMSFAYLGGLSGRSSVTSSDYGSHGTDGGKSRLLMDDSKNDLFFSLADNKWNNITISDPKTIVCTGAGAITWGIYTARAFPGAQVVILESESLQWPVPANCTVENADVEDYRRGVPCDYLFVRNIRTARSYKTYLSHLRHLVRRGGQVEIVDIDDIPSKVCTCQSVWTKATTCNTCLQFPDARRRRDLMREAGFRDLKIIFHQKRWETLDNTIFYGVTIKGKVA